MTRWLIRVNIPKNATYKRLRIRTSPSMSASIVGRYYNGNEVIVDQKKVLSNGQIWYRVESSKRWIAKNNPADKWVKSYFDIIKTLPDREVKKPEPEPQPTPVQTPPSKDLMDGDSIRNKGDDDSYRLDRAMKDEEDGRQWWREIKERY